MPIRGVLAPLIAPAWPACAPRRVQLPERLGHGLARGFLAATRPRLPSELAGPPGYMLRSFQGRFLSTPSGSLRDPGKLPITLPAHR